MTESILQRLIDTADEHFDGHVTIMKFTTKWRVGFGTPGQVSSNRADDVEMMEGKTLEEAATKALANPRRCDCVTKDVIY
jgi:hypothetical protein